MVSRCLKGIRSISTTSTRSQMLFKSLPTVTSCDRKASSNPVQLKNSTKFRTFSSASKVDMFSHLDKDSYENNRDESQLAPSIFNDVLGPVMRGPSSSHGAAALRIGRMVRDLMDGDVKKVLVEYDPNGSLVTTHSGQGSDMGLFGGLLGWDADEPRLMDFKKYTDEAGIEVDIQYVSYDAKHPNTYKLTMWSNEGEMREMLAISVGGGMIEVEEIDQKPVKMVGDFQETVVTFDDNAEAEEYEGWLAKQECADEFCGVAVSTSPNTNGALLTIKSREPLPRAVIDKLNEAESSVVREIKPVLPVLSSKSIEVPFLSAASMLKYNEGKDLPFWKLAAQYESARGGISEEQVVAEMTKLVRIMKAAVADGRKGTSYKDRILPCQTVNFEAEMNRGGLVPGDIINKIILYVSAIMEVKSSMGVFVAAPTAGSAGALPGSVLAVADTLEKTEEEITQAMLVAGFVGVLIAEHATFAAEVAGCMAECGSGCGMAAAAITTLGGGNIHQALGATSLALQSSMGMTCDPIANRVEAPCLGKNTLAGTNALTSANMALARFEHLIPLDEVLVAFYEVGKSLPDEVCCTGKGGLSITPTARKIEEGLGEARYDWETAAPGKKRKIAC